MLKKISDIISGSPRRIAIGLGVLKFLKAVLSLFSIILSAKYFGATLERDCWVLSFAVVMIIIQFLFGPLNEIFRAKFVHTKEEESEENALEANSSLSGGILIISLLIIVICMFSPRLLSNLWAPGFDLEQKKVLDLMLRLMIPLILLQELSILWTALLNAYDSFYIPEVLAVISTAVNIIAIIVLAPHIGIYSLVISLYFNLAVLLVTMYRALKRKNPIITKFSLPKWSRISSFIMFSLPFYLPYILGQLAASVERIICTMLSVGSVSVLDYARKFVDTPVSVIFGVITTVMTPLLAKLFSNGKDEEFNEETIKFIRLAFLLLIPVSVLFTVCPLELISLLLLRGSFTAENAVQTAGILSWFGYGLLGVILYIICGQAMIARKKTAYYAFIGALVQIGSIAINYALYKKWGITTLAASWSLCHIAGGILLFLKVNPGFLAKSAYQMMKISVSATLIFIVSHIFHRSLQAYLMNFAYTSQVIYMIIIGITMTIATIMLVFNLFIFKFEERYFVVKIIKKLNPIKQTRIP